MSAPEIEVAWLTKGRAECRFLVVFVDTGIHLGGSSSLSTSSSSSLFSSSLGAPVTTPAVGVKVELTTPGISAGVDGNKMASEWDECACMLIGAIIGRVVVPAIGVAVGVR